LILKFKPRAMAAEGREAPKSSVDAIDTAKQTTDSADAGTDTARDAATEIVFSQSSDKQARLSKHTLISDDAWESADISDHWRAVDAALDILDTRNGTKITIEMIKHAQHHDAECQVIMGLLNHSPTMQKLPKIVTRAASANKMSLDRKGVVRLFDKIYVPASMRGAMVRSQHHQFKHPGTARLREIIASEFIWPRMNADIADHCRSCVTDPATRGDRRRPNFAAGDGRRLRCSAHNAGCIYALHARVAAEVHRRRHRRDGHAQRVDLGVWGP
jgi:hypothetical protein